MTAWLRSSPASRSTPITTSAKYLPPEERTRRARTSVTPGSDATTVRRFASAPAGALSMSALTFERASLIAPSTTRQPTKSAASASALGWPSAVSPSPTMTASVPAKSAAKCTALAPSAALPSLRATRSDVVARAASITSTSPSIAAAYQVASTLSAVAREPDDRRHGDPHGREHEDGRLAERGQVLRLAVPVGMLVVGRALGDADRVQREQRGRRVDAGVHGLGEDAEAAGEIADEQLDGDEGERRAEGEERGAPGRRHRGIVLVPLSGPGGPG